ncbi:hypothetical protein CEUSTIGMA_g8364.t1 [Chlamydomonas eustigma]|uniref:Prolyl endopeptidase-like n=1 Tax=Chlamydomonas eustigma TaxID=1157962 RepID=A0A250XDD6_9CHLO|nr:hypothetical protein CEUSTIGMA_g8364.t1 [Chlamydomonas eustigma]|eukprot:GAX80929.1 hypothetical protein CEUSTIGMA_g8364.t1 [Chlamydomonas eustigma]
MFKPQVSRLRSQQFIPNGVRPLIVREASKRPGYSALQPPPTPQSVESTALPALHGDIRKDSYGWMRDASRSRPEVMLHLKKEDDYARAALMGTSKQWQLFKDVRQEIEAATWEAAVEHATAEEANDVPVGFVEVMQCERITFELKDGKEKESTVKVVRLESRDNEGWVFFIRSCRPPTSHSPESIVRPCRPPTSHSPESIVGPSAGTRSSGESMRADLERDNVDSSLNQIRISSRKSGRSTPVQVCRVRLSEWQRVFGIHEEEIGQGSVDRFPRHQQESTSETPEHGLVGNQVALNLLQDVTVVIDIEERGDQWWAALAARDQPRKYPHSCSNAKALTQAAYKYCLYSWEPSWDGELVAFTEGYERIDGQAEEPWAEHTELDIPLHSSDEGNQSPDRNDLARVQERAQGLVDRVGDTAAQTNEHLLSEQREAGGLTRWGRMTLHVLDAGSGDPVLPPIGRVQGSLAWSPEGPEVHFLASGAAQLWTLSVVTGTPQLVFQDPEYLHLAFKRSGPCGLLSVHAIGSDMLAAQVLLLLPACRQDTHSFPLGGTDADGALTASDVQSSRENAQDVHSNVVGKAVETLDKGLGSDQQCSKRPKNTFRLASKRAVVPLSLELQKPLALLSWQWCNLMPRTLGCRLEIYVLAKSDDQRREGNQVGDKVALEEVQREWHSRPRLLQWASNCTLIIRQWDAERPLGRILALPLGSAAATTTLLEDGKHFGGADVSYSAAAATILEDRAHSGGTDASYSGAATANHGVRDVLPLPLCRGMEELLPEDAGLGCLVKVQVSYDTGQLMTVHERWDEKQLHVSKHAILSLREEQQRDGTPLDATVDVDNRMRVQQKTGATSTEVAGHTDEDAEVTVDHRQKSTFLISVYQLSGQDVHFVGAPENNSDGCDAVFGKAEGSSVSSSGDVFQLKVKANKEVTIPVPFVQLEPVRWFRSECSPANSLAIGNLPDVIIPSSSLDGQHIVVMQYSSLALPPHNLMVRLQSHSQHTSRSKKAVLSPQEEQAEVLGVTKYIHKRVWVQHGHSVGSTISVPISLVYRKDMPTSSGLTSEENLPSRAPVLMQVYGSFGLPENLAYQPGRLPLLDRGWVLAVPHIRGGGHLGPAWHEGGKKELKLNAAADFYMCAHALTNSGLVLQGKLAVEAASAGAWVAVPTVLQSESLFCAAALTVPSLDPLSEVITGAYGWHELGCPQQQKEYQVAKACSPQDVLTLRDALIKAKKDLKGVKGTEAPDGDSGAVVSILDLNRVSGSAVDALKRSGPKWLVRSALFDHRVGFWEHSSFVAKMRTYLVTRSSGLNVPPVLFRVKAENHLSFEGLSDDAELCIFCLT